MITTHSLQNFSASALKRKVDVLADVRVLRHSVYDFIGEVFRVRRSKPKSDFGIGLGCSNQQLSKPWSWPIPQLVHFPEVLSITMKCSIALLRDIMVAIYILPEEGYFLDSLLLQDSYFFENAIQLPTALPSPNEWHYAERAHIVAAPHD